MFNKFIKDMKLKKDNKRVRFSVVSSLTSNDITDMTDGSSSMVTYSEVCDNL